MHRYFKDQELLCVSHPYEGRPYFTKKHNLVLPQIGKTYTVRELINTSKGNPGVLLKEVVNDPVEFVDDIVEPAFYEHHFIPKAEKVTKITSKAS